MSATAFRDHVLAPQFGRVDGRLNVEAISLGPLLTDDDQFFFDVCPGSPTRRCARRHVTAVPSVSG